MDTEIKSSTTCHPAGLLGRPRLLLWLAGLVLAGALPACERGGARKPSEEGEDREGGNGGSGGTGGGMGA